MRFAAVVFLLATTSAASAQDAPGTCRYCIKDFAIAYPAIEQMHAANMYASTPGSTHELTFNRNGGKTLWITAPMYDAIVEVTMDGAQKFHPMPKGSMPHGIAFDAEGRLYVSLEGDKAVALVNAKTGKIEKHFRLMPTRTASALAPTARRCGSQARPRTQLAAFSATAAYSITSYRRRTLCRFILSPGLTATCGSPN